MWEAAGGRGEGVARDTESKTRTPHKDVGNNTMRWTYERYMITEDVDSKKQRR